MQLHLIAVGTKMPDWVSHAFTTYQKRLPADYQLSLTEIPAGKRGKNADIKRILKHESDATLSAVPRGHRIVALDVRGQAWDTHKLAGNLEKWQLDGRPISFLIGGPEGMDQACVNAADHRWSLSPLTLPHPLVRVVVAEALYRAWAINHNHPYHRE